MNATAAEIAPWETTKKQLGLIRKALRIGKFVEHFRAAAQAWDTKAAGNGGTFTIARLLNQWISVLWGRYMSH